MVSLRVKGVERQVLEPDYQTEDDRNGQQGDRNVANHDKLGGKWH